MRLFQQSTLTAFVSCLLLVALLLQVVPFAFHQAVPAADATERSARHYFKPLQVCGDSQVPGGFLADLPWISPSSQRVLFVPEGESFFSASSQFCPEGFSTSVYRPPRTVLPLT